MGHIGDGFSRVNWPNQHIKALKEASVSPNATI